MQNSAMAGLGLSFLSGSMLSGCTSTTEHSAEFKKLTFDLLKDWCDGMIRMQVTAPANPKVHGLLEYPVCETVHTRCFDAVYLFLYMVS